MLRTGLAGALVVLASTAVARPLTVPVGTSLIVEFAGTPPRPVAARRGPLGDPAPGPGEITVALAPPGNAVRSAKLHVFERTRTPIAFTATALRRGRPLATQLVCGRIEMDAWVTVPAGTEKVVLTRFTLAETGCES